MRINMLLSMSITLLCGTLRHVHTTIVSTHLKKISGNGEMENICLNEAGKRQYMAIMVDGENTCRGLDWTWGAARNYAPEWTYFEKKRVVEEYNPPESFSGNLILPIVLVSGAYVNIYMELTTLNFEYGAIMLMDVLGYEDIYDDIQETLMIIFEIRPMTNSITVKTWKNEWSNKLDMTYNFSIGHVYKLTFRAQTNLTEIRLNDNSLTSYNHVVPSEDARAIMISNFGMLLHKLEWIGV